MLIVAVSRAIARTQVPGEAGDHGRFRGRPLDHGQCELSPSCAWPWASAR
jgi:hypothetical protein